MKIKEKKDVDWLRGVFINYSLVTIYFCIYHPHTDAAILQPHS